MRVPVLLAGWELGCCVPAPGVGDRVAWQLAWVTDSAGPGSGRRTWSQVVPVLDHGGLLGWRLRDEELHAWCEATSPQVPDVGALRRGSHGDVPEDLPVTHGRVRRVDVVEQTFRRVGEREWHCVPGTYAVRPVDRGPPSLDDTGPAPRADTWSHEDAVLVELEVGRIRPAASPARPSRPPPAPPG